MTKTKASPPRANAAEIEEGTAFAPKFDADGLVPVVVTSAGTGEVLMLAHMNAEALARTLETGEAQFLVAIAQAPLAQGRGKRQHHARGRDAHGLRSGRALAEGGDRRRRGVLSHGPQSCFYRVVPIGKGADGVALHLCRCGAAVRPQPSVWTRSRRKGNLKDSELVWYRKVRRFTCGDAP